MDIIFTRGGLEQAVRMTQEGEDPILSLEESRIEIFSNPWDLPSGLTTTSGRITNDPGHHRLFGDSRRGRRRNARAGRGVDRKLTVETDARHVQHPEEQLAAQTAGRDHADLYRRQGEETRRHADRHAGDRRGLHDLHARPRQDHAQGHDHQGELKHNLGSLLGKVVCTPTYEGASADWIENITLEDKVLSFDVKANDSEAPAQRVDRLSLPGTAGELTPAAPFVVEQTYEADYRTLIKGESDRS